MNNILELKGHFDHRNAPNNFGPISLPAGAKVKVAHLKELAEGLQRILLYWQEDTLIQGALVINANRQGDEGRNSLYEAEARKIYRKWDNVKLVCEEIKKRVVPRKVYGAGMWGLSIKTKECLKPRNGRGLRFGVVITLKEMNGANRIDDFIKLCQVRGWIVNQVNVENRLDVYTRAEEELKID